MCQIIQVKKNTYGTPFIFTGIIRPSSLDTLDGGIFSDFPPMVGEKNNLSKV